MPRKRQTKSKPSVADRIRAGHTPRTAYEKRVDRELRKAALNAIKGTDTKHYERKQTRHELATFDARNMNEALDLMRYGSDGAYSAYARITYTDSHGRKQTAQTPIIALFNQDMSDAVSMLGGAVSFMASEYEVDTEDAELEIGFVYDESGW